MNEIPCLVVCSLFHNIYLLHLYLYASECCPVQLFPFSWPQSSKRSKNALFIYCSSGPRSLRQTSLCACVPLLCNSSPSMWKGRKLTSYLIFSTAARGSDDKRLFKKSSCPPAFIRRLFEEIYSQSLPQSLLCTTNRAFRWTVVDGRINNWHPAWRDTNKHWSEPEVLWGK